MLREEKQNLVQELGQRLKGSSIALCADYRGLKVSQISMLRRELRATECSVEVVKNTLIRRAVNDAYSDEDSKEVSSFLNILKGPTLVITNHSDPIAPTKIVAKFVKEIECLSVKGAFFEGDFLDSAKVDMLSKMPGREELLSQLLRTILEPATRIVRVINEPATQMARLISAYEEKLGKTS